MADAELFAVALVALAACVLWLGFAASRHRRNLRAVPVRIHVAGTRGKSTTTRLIAAGLRAGGRRVVAKTTGTAPRLILPDGNERPWPRRGPASVGEQTRLFAQAARLGADVVVVECMAIRPELVWASETHLIQATTAVITNARPDHFEDLGDDPKVAADALRWAVPTGGRLIVADEAVTPDLRTWTTVRGTGLTMVDTADLAPQQVNRALALAVCAAHGVAADVAGPAMESAATDPGMFSTHLLAIDGKAVRFANAFACNDAGSLALLWQTVPAGGNQVVLLNARRDRPLRTQRLLDFLAAQAPLAALFIVGDPLAVSFARRAGFQPGTVRRLHAATPAAALTELAAAAPTDGMIWGVGNYQGFGARLVAELPRHDPPC